MAVAFFSLAAPTEPWTDLFDNESNGLIVLLLLLLLLLLGVLILLLLLNSEPNKGVVAGVRLDDATADPDTDEGYTEFEAWD